MNSALPPSGGVRKYPTRATHRFPWLATSAGGCFMSTRFFPLTPIAVALLLPLGASANAAVPAPPQMCGHEEMPEIDPRYRMVCALDQGITANLAADQSDRITTVLEQLAPRETGLFFPKGTYRVDKDLPLRTGNVLVGSPAGATRFVNSTGTASEITEVLHSAKNIRVEHLILDNITVRTFDSSNAVIRNNRFENTRTPHAQLRVSGAAVVDGNVFLRGPGNRGTGIVLTNARQAKVIGNWIGEDPSQTHDQRRATSPERSSGYFKLALVSSESSVDVLIRKNRMTVALDTKSAEPLRLAYLSGAVGLILDDNVFKVINGRNDQQQPAVELRAPQDTTVVRNTFLAVPLRLLPSDGEAVRPPIKRTNVIANSFVEATVDTTQITTGWSATATTPDDLVFTSNRFSGGESACMLNAPEPTTSGMTYGEADNLMQGTGDGAKACNLRNLSPEDARARVPEPFHPAAAPVVNADDLSLARTNRAHRQPLPTLTTVRPGPPPSIQATSPEPSTHRVKPGGHPLPIQPDVGPAEDAPPTAHPAQGWLAWLSAELHALLHRMTAMFSGR
ncbi:hypothetical protein [Roseateles chitinivorans]|uniref:hypothetical protein n=1 Tax=Roseateles chitinivorans TaxID=2917965 RepID=UPI003D66514F